LDAQLCTASLGFFSPALISAARVTLACGQL
jgi:hypothetical protein